eukprot:CAMPEP_0202842870 /NCGR_PEP_ID=MMETSP1389-20130828/62611_1 /ASSEMBLY_ACC=CAM_ASM_000865 /TAXON_ID=302021 /ORGANISM="Rhodomonas sp., Strain CCMP768" /LENGTH=51 /DNA_ID=CAMNT_0049519919 /DNA_START=263 /DNA_END=414 /DNA_ORIENTATION=+
MTSVFPDTMQTRAEQVQQLEVLDADWIPIFVLGPVTPGVKLLLHIFEPRYR